ncbi:MAG: hypothetical protein CMI52_02570 [Parcubacteria group bacterium]|nr:hypothetical protein [Parcubacteria group bacterium]
MEKVTIHNRKGENVVVEFKLNENPKGLVFVMHGLGGFKEQSHLQVIVDAFLEENYSVVRFDTTNSVGESDGDYFNATVTNYYEDLEDLIDWTNGQSWYEEPFVLVGHSLGGMCVSLFAQKHPEKVKALAPIASVISGELSTHAPRYEDGSLITWEKEGKMLRGESPTKQQMWLAWHHMEDRMHYDLTKDANKLTMPVLLVVGDKDISTPPEHQKALFDVLPGKKEIHVIKGSKHTFKGDEHKTELKKYFTNWITTL